MAIGDALETYLATAGSPEVAATVAAMTTVATSLARRIARGPLDGALGASVGVNTGGDGQKALDVIADHAFIEALRAAPVRWIASEEQDGVVELNPSGALAVAFDPLDGSSNIDVNVSIGTIFAIYPAEADGEASFLRPGHQQLAAGYVVYGPQTALTLSLGKGVMVFLLDPETGQFRQIAADVRIPPSSREFAINASNYRHWPRPIRAYVDDCMSGEEGPRGANFNMRWIASLVAEAHRILLRGGVFLYPGDGRKGYERGRLRMVYECAPIAFLVEQAGGKATDGSDRILDQIPATLHARTPLVFGSVDKVARVAAYFDLPESEISPLFGRRGLFNV